MEQQIQAAAQPVKPAIEVVIGARLPKGITADMIPSIINAYAEGSPICKIAADNGVTPFKIRRILSKPIRDRERKNHAERRLKELSSVSDGFRETKVIAMI